MSTRCETLVSLYSSPQRVDNQYFPLAQIPWGKPLDFGPEVLSISRALFAHKCVGFVFAAQNYWTSMAQGLEVSWEGRALFSSARFAELRAEPSTVLGSLAPLTLTSSEKWGGSNR